MRSPSVRNDASATGTHLAFEERAELVEFAVDAIARPLTWHGQSRALRLRHIS